MVLGGSAELARSAMINSKFGPEYARKNPTLVAKYIDLIIAERASSAEP